MRRRSTILIVDNEEFNVDYLEQELADLGYATLSAASGQEALTQTATAAPDLILLDIMMPTMNGFQVLEQLKADPTWRHIPVIIISALSDMVSIVKGIQLGAEDYLSKPFNPTLLRARLSSCLEKKRLHDQEMFYQRRLAHEQEIVRQLQATFLPTALPQPPGWTLTARLLAAPTVAGDFYDAFPVANGERIGLMIGTVDNQGGAAALLMPLFRSLLRANVTQEDLIPVGVRAPRPLDDATRLQTAVTLTNEYIAHAHGPAGQFTTLFFGLLDPQTGALCYLNGGHEPPFILNTTGVKSRLPATGPVVGRWPGSTFPLATTCLAPGDMLFVFTASLTNAPNPQREPLGQVRLLQWLEKGAASPTALLDQIEAGLRTHRAGVALDDEITLFVVSRT